MNSIHSSSREVVIRHLRSVPLQLVKFAKITWHKDLKNKFVKFVKFVVQKKQNVMKESTKKTLKRVAEIVITIITALLTTLGAHAAGIVQ